MLFKEILNGFYILKQIYHMVCFAKVILNIGNSTDFVIPTSAIYQTGDKPHVWIVVNKHVQLIPVEIKSYRENDVIVQSGLKKGDVVVSGGVNKLTTNDEVKLEDGDIL